LAEEHPLHAWVDPSPVVLGSLADQLGDERADQVWVEAVARFAGHALSERLPIGDTPPVAAAGVPRFDTTLDLYASALLAVLDSGDEAKVTAEVDAGDPLAGVLAHEHRQVSAALQGAGLVLDEVQRDWALAVVALRAVATVEAAVQALAAAPVLRGLDDRRLRRLAEVLGRLYADESGELVWRAPGPDRLVDTHLLGLAGRAASRAEWIAAVQAVCGGDDPEVAAQAAAVLHRCLSAPVPAGPYAAGRDRVDASIRALLATSPAAYAPVLTVLDPQRYTDEIVAAVAGGGDATTGLTVEQVESLDGMLRELGFATTRVRVAVAVSERLVAATRPAPGARAQAWDRYAGELNSLSVRLGELGRREEALAAVREAVVIRRRLAGANPAAYLPNPAAYLPDLAGSLNNLSVHLGRLGRREEGLAAAEEAVEAYRRLAEANPAAYLPNLATSLNNLSLRLGELGRHKKAEKVAAEARRALSARRHSAPDA
jgi:tetratricopeptide (TPR) repeat protein